MTGKRNKAFSYWRKINWNAVSAIAAVVALISTVIISSVQMQRSQEIFEEQFSFDTTYYRKQFEFEKSYIEEQLQLMREEMALGLEQAKKNDSITKINMDLTKEAIGHEDNNKAKIIPNLLFLDLLEKHWYIRILQRLQSGNDNNEARIDYIFETKLNTSIFHSINIYDLFLALNKNPDLAHQIISIYHSIDKVHEEYVGDNFNQRIDSIEGIPFPIKLPIKFQNFFGDASILEGTKLNIKKVITSINSKYHYLSRDSLEKEVSKQILGNDLIFQEIR